ncbi:MAG TPA: AgmX/PglI C-terminal domain-containing protein [Polyangia bacterium]|jgi:hypothetical protein
MKTSIFALFLAVATLGAGCQAALIGPSFRSDLQAKMASAQAPLTECYTQLLARDRRAHGNMTVKFQIQPNTGIFSGTQIVQSQIKDPEFDRCVTTVVGGLHLGSAPNAKVDVDYPLAFTRIRTPKAAPGAAPAP